MRAGMSKLHLIRTQAEPVPGIVEALEELLVSAKRGDLQGFAFVAAGERQIVTDWTGAPGTRNSIATGIMLLGHRYAQAVLDD